MGNFILRARISSDVNLQANGASDAAVISSGGNAATAINSFTVDGLSAKLQCTNAGDPNDFYVRVVLDTLILDDELAGTYTISTDGIPTGFTPITANIIAAYGPTTWSPADGVAEWTSNCALFLQRNIATEYAVTATASSADQLTLTPAGGSLLQSYGPGVLPQAYQEWSIPISPVPSGLNLINDGLGFRYTVTLVSGATGGFNLDAFYITGTYSIEAYQYYLVEVVETIEDQTFTRQELTQVFDGDEPPEDSVPFGDPDTAPDFLWWEFEFGDILWYLYQPESPGTGWVEVAEPDNYGWWRSFEEFQGGALLIVNGNPKKPRTFAQLTNYSNMFGGFPGAGTVRNFRLIYAGKDYSAQPVIRVFDGLSDRELARIPAVSGTDADAIISMVTANGTIYVTTLDSGSTDTTYAGRVFELDVASAQLTQIGAQFTGGEVPYAIAWHNGMLWCGTNPAGDGDEGGKIYSFRPGVDTVWTEDHDLDTNGLGGCTGLVSFQGRLIATTTTVSGDNANVLARAIDGTWSVIATGAGDDGLNFYGSPTVYDDKLYVTYFDVTEGAFIYSYDGSSFTLELTSDYDDRPFIGLYLGSGNIYALGGGLGETAVLYGSEDGDTWDDLTEFLPGFAEELATPIFAEVRAA